MINTIVNSFEVWTDAQGIKSRNRVNGVDNISLEGLKRLRELLLDLALSGKVTSQNQNEESGPILLKKINDILTSEYGKEFSNKLKRDRSTIDPTLFYCPIPKNWVWCELQDIAIFINGKAHEQFITDEPNYILINSRFVSTNGKIKKYTTERLTPLSKGDIAIVMSDVPDGNALVKCYLVEENNKYTLNQRIGGISSCDALNIKFLSLVLNRNKYYLQYNDGKKQTNLKRIQILSCPIPLPPLAEQHRIVAKVDELMALCDKLEEEQFKNLKTHQSLVKTLLETLTQAADANELQAAWKRMAKHFNTLFCTEDSIEQLKQTILQLAVMGKLVKQDPNDETASELLNKIAKEKEKLVKKGKLKKQLTLAQITENEKSFEIPLSWEWSRLQNLTVYIQRGKGPKYSLDGKVQVVSQKCIQWSGFDLFQAKYIEDSSIKDYQPERFLRNDDLLWNSTGTGTVGRINVLNNIIADSLVADSHVTVIRPILINSSFLCYYLKSPIIQQRIKPGSINALVSGSTNQVELNTSSVNSVLIPVPPLLEQHRIIVRVNELFEMCESLKDKIIKTQKLKISLSKTIIEKVVS